MTIMLIRSNPQLDSMCTHVMCASCICTCVHLCLYVPVRVHMCSCLCVCVHMYMCALHGETEVSVEYLSLFLSGQHI